MDQIAAAMAGQGPPAVGVEAGAEVNLGLQIGRLASALESDRKRRQLLAMCITVVDIGPVAYQVTGGNPVLAPYRSSASDMSPQEGLIWDVARLSLAGLNVGDVVNLYRPAGVNLAVLAAACHTFACPAGVAAGAGIADWGPPAHGLFMRPDDTFTLASAGTLAAANLVLSGQAVQVDLKVLADYLM
jgi:hypothetical protein